MTDPLTPAQRSMRASLAAHTRWSREPDRAAATRPALDGLMAKFELQVDPDGALDPADRSQRAASARSAHFKGLQLKSSRTRAAGRGKPKQAP